MPGFLVSPTTMNVVVNAIDRNYRLKSFAGLPLVSNGDLQKLGALLYTVNAEAVRLRFPVQERLLTAPEFTFRPIRGRLDPELARACLETLIFACSVRASMKGEAYAALVDFSVKLSIEAARARQVKPAWRGQGAYP